MDTIYRQLKYDVAKRDKYMCVIGPLMADKRCLRAATDLHHILPRSNPTATTHTLKNAVLACRYCHEYYGQSKKLRVLLIQHLASKFGYQYDEPEYKPYL